MNSKEYEEFIADLNGRIEKATAEWGGQAGYDEWYHLVKGNDTTENNNLKNKNIMKKQEMQLEIAKAIAPTITYYWLSQIDYTPKRELPRNIAEDIAEQSRLIVDQLLKQD